MKREDKRGYKKGHRSPYVDINEHSWWVIDGNWVDYVEELYDDEGNYVSSYHNKFIMSDVIEATHRTAVTKAIIRLVEEDKKHEYEKN